MILGKFHDIVFINHDETCQVFSPVPDDDGVIDIDAGFQLVFDILGCYIFSACRDNDVFFAIGDF